MNTSFCEQEPRGGSVSSFGTVGDPQPASLREEQESSSVMRDLGYSFLARASTMLFSVANQSALAWFLGPSERGAYAVALIFANMLAVLFVLGIDQAGQYYVASGKMTRAEGSRATIILGLGLSFLAVLVGCVLLLGDIDYFRKAPRIAFVIALGLVPILILNTCLNLLLMGLRKFKALAIISIVLSVLQVLSVGFFVMALGLGVEGALWCSVVSGIVQLALGFRILRSEGALGPTPLLWSDIKAILSYGARFYVGSITVAMNVQVGTVLMAFFAQKEEIGIFSVAVDFMTRVVVVPDIVGQVVQPRVASDARGRPELVARTARYVALICSGIIALILIASWFIVPILFSPEFKPMIPLLWILGAGVASRCAAKVLIPFLNGTNRPGIFSLASLAGILVNVALIVLLFPSERLAGAAWALTCSFLVSSAILAIAFWKFSGLSLRDTWIPRQDDVIEVVSGLRSFRTKLAAWLGS